MAVHEVEARVLKNIDVHWISIDDPNFPRRPVLRSCQLFGDGMQRWCAEGVVEEDDRDIVGHDVSRRVAFLNPDPATAALAAPEEYIAARDFRARGGNLNSDSNLKTVMGRKQETSALARTVVDKNTTACTGGNVAHEASEE